MMDLSSIIRKIGHSLVEIRVRALKSIMCKLDHALISISDIVQERMLFVYLLEWFNFPEVPMQEEVLELLSSLAKHPGAAQMLRDVGAVDFLTQLSPNVEPRLRAVIDGTLDQLFQLPDLLPSQAMAYAHGSHAGAPTDEELLPVGYFHKGEPSQADVPPQRIAVHESVRCLKFSVFPWLTLTNTDRHILSSNESSLRSGSPNLVRTTCELLCDVIMQDFPAEIFLQRPSIVKSLLSLLRLSSTKGEAGFLHLQALSCLRQLCVGLRRRLRFHQDPSFYSTKQDPASQNSSFSVSQETRPQRSQASSPAAEGSPRPSVVGRTGQRARGDGQDGDAAGNSVGSQHRAGRAPQSPVADASHLPLPDAGADDALELQLQQLTLAQFAVAAMEHAIPLLRTEGPHVFRRTLELLCDAVLLLGDSVCELVWDDRSLPGTELREKLQGCMELLGDVLSYHASSSAADAPSGSLPHHRAAYAGVAALAVKLLQTVLPVEKAADNIPESTTEALFHLCLDPSFGGSFPSMQEAAVAYLEQVNPDGHDVYRRVTRAALWMEATCSFLKEAQAKGEKNWLELLELADRAVDGLSFHQHLPVVKECVDICSHLWKFDQPSPLLRSESQKLLLKLLAHPSAPVRTETYQRTLDLLKDCLGIQSATRQEAAACGGVNFLLHHRVLYEIIAFGLQDSTEKVSAAAKDALLFLLKGRLMMTASTWDRLNEALHPVTPILQGYANTEESLGKCVLLLTGGASQSGDVALSSTAKLAAALRLLFTKQPAVRMAAAQQILPLLTGPDDGGGAARPELEERAATASLPNLYCVRNPLDLSLDSSGKSVLKMESVEKLFCILCSDSVDAPLRRSAAEQLAVVLQDTRMHPVLKGLGITDRAISFVVDSSNGSESLDCLLEPSVCILRKLLFADPPLRRSLARRSPLLLALLRASLLLKANKSSGSEAAALMALLLFDEVAEIETWSDRGKTDVASETFSLPLSLTRRFHLPFKAATHHAVSPFRCVLPPSSDLLTLPPSRQALQVAWNAAWHSGMDNLLEELPRAASSTSSKFHSDLALSEGQLLSLRVLHPPGALRDCLQAISTAAGHVPVTSALSRLGLYLLIDRLALPHSATYGCRETLRSLNWQAVVSRFLQVHPASVEDKRLLVAVVAFLNVYFREEGAVAASAAEDGDLRWMLELLLNQESLFSLLFSTEGKASARSSGEPDELMNHVSRRLQRELSRFFNLLLHRLENTADRLCLALAGPFRSQLAARLLQSLRVSDAPRFYGLPSLERTLQAMVTLTAQPGWSSHCPDAEPAALCSKYLSGLLEVISSFYVEWGGNSLSFMGKGVTKNALISLLHLSHEMMAQNKGEDFIPQWSLGNEAATEDGSTSQLGLAWLIPLWVDRDQEVRFASMGLGASLSSVPSGCQALCASCQNISGGLWGTLLNILLDRQESSAVRREAAFILQNLLVMPMLADPEEAKDSQWQHPCVHDEVTGLSLLGLPALQALLYHCRYFQHVALCASSCYQGRRVFHSQPCADAGGGLFPPENTLLDSEDSLLFWRSVPPASADNHRRPSSSLSTSSTMSRGSMLHTPKGPSPLNVTEDTPASRLMTQGQSDTDTSDSAFSPDSRHSELPPAASPVAVVTPGLMAAHCGLLSNLVAILPDFTLTALRHNQLLEALAGLVRAGPVEKCVTELKTANIQPGEREVIKGQIATSLHFLSGFSRLLQSCVTVSSELIGRLGPLKQLVATLVAVLTLNPEGLDAGTRDAVCECWADLFTLLATLVRRDGSAAYPSVSAALGRRWRSFAGTLSACVDERTGDHPAHAAALQFLAAVFTEETKSRGAEVPTAAAAASSSSSSSSSSSVRDTVNSPAAGRLCELLLQSFEKKSLQDPSRRPAARALMTLLACSPAAQTHAAKAGVIDSCVEQMKQSHSQLQLESVRPGKVSRSKKEEGHLKEVKLHAEILRSALYCNDECKAVATEARLTPAVHALWPWLLLDDGAMEAALELLCVYTAGSAAACSSLCGSGSGAAAGPKGTHGGSLMHSVMKLASGVAPDNGTVQMLAFSLLANLAVSRECRGVLQKNHFLQAFPSVPAPKAGGVKTSTGGGGGLLGLWLRLLVNLSFAEDGQQSVLKVPEALDVLADLAQHRRLALLTLHNLCFCPANKPHVIANDKAMKVLISCLSSKEAETRCMGASALWALLHNNQRAKTTLKCPSVRLRIEEAHNLSKKDADSKQDANTSYLLKCLDNLSQLLNT
ncbi:rotatin isoform X2 [Nelusetta ayraudi]|uniref:rotatin isoform X2 n=1 Tax=Nelusetta ayraudi TaxID=303726 RepID=UPI003F71822E